MNKVGLDFNRASEYFKDHVVSGNTLSALILKKIDFTEGHFITLLPDNAYLNQIEDFKSGGILPPVGPVIKFPNGKGAYQLKPNTKELLVEFIKNFLMIDSSNLCVAEDVIRKPLHLKKIQIFGMQLIMKRFFILLIKEVKMKKSRALFKRQMQFIIY